MLRTLSLLPALLLLAPSSAAIAQSDGAVAALAGPIVTLAVTESVDAPPNIATLNTGVETRAQTAKEAMAQNAAKIDTLIAALLKAGIARKDIQTSGINLNPQYDYSQRPDTTGQPQGPRFIGYQANNNLSVVIRKIDKAGETVDAMVNAGATNINGPTFSIEDTSKLQEQARGKAVLTAQARANFYAQAAGYRSARLLAISETGEFASPPMPMGGMLRLEAADRAKTQIEPGQLSTSITLNFRYMLER